MPMICLKIADMLILGVISKFWNIIKYPNIKEINN